ncbi:MAG: glycosyl hydrolase family 65 protein [Clostridia bacterium]
MTETHIGPWEITCEGAITDFTESVFFLGNGELGVRGFSLQEPKAVPSAHAMFKAGLFERVKPGITDMVQLPDVLGLRMEGAEQTKALQTLDMRHGILTQCWQSGGLTICQSRMVSMADSQLLCVRMTITANEASTIKVIPAMDSNVCNLPVLDDQMQEETETVKLLEAVLATEQELLLQTVHSKQSVRFLCQIQADHMLETRLQKGESITVEKRVRVLIGNEEPHENTDNPWAEHEAAWEALWQDCDIELEAEARIQGAVRYNIFQLLCNNASKNPSVSIGARGLSHGRYKGNTFWDTDIFLLPFYTWERPEAARNLMRYRYDRLDAAKALASKQSLQGARYPWMCANDGTEQCESWDIGLCETHVTADVAYAVSRYLAVVKDPSFAKDCAPALYLETARYWLSRFTWEPSKNQYSSFFVKGPDEYCGAAINNTYTNWMARNNVQLALEKAAPNEHERAQMKHFTEHVAILYDEERKLYLQDEAFERLEPLPKPLRDGTPLYKQICFDKMQRYRALKQADLVQLMVLFPRAFTFEQQENVWNAYEPLTVHDSTLSYGVHAHLAFQLGHMEQAWTYFQKSLLLDLEDVLHNTGKEGIHMAALGASWQALVFGAVGLWSENGKPTVKPNLPKQIKKLSMRICYQGQRYHITASENHATVTQEGLC